MKKNILYTAFLIGTFLNAQEKINRAELQKIKEEAQLKYDEAKAYEKLHLKNKHSVPEGISYEGRNSMGIPEYISTDSRSQINSMNVDYLYDNTISEVAVTGDGMLVYIWDGGAVRATHQEFGGHVSNIETDNPNHSHATPVAGVIIAQGINANAQGIAYEANLKSYNFANNVAEISNESGNEENEAYMISNHSYSSRAGWNYLNNNWYWYGYPNISETESVLFGLYTSTDQSWDNIAYNAPQHTMFKSAGNNRNAGPNETVNHYAYAPDGTWEYHTGVYRPKDCVETSGYDCISFAGSVAKNIILVGAIKPLGGDNRYEQPSDVIETNITSFGPTDDGRIKPDVTAIGEDVITPTSTNNTSYGASVGTSFSSPAAAGVGLLLQQIKNEFDGGYLRSDMMKALLTHTAFEAGDALGPDYRFGYGLINAFGAAETLLNVNENAYTRDTAISKGGTYTIDVVATGNEPLKASIAWLDPGGTPLSEAVLNDRTPMLVNDLDLSITDNEGNTYLPWKLNPDAPSAPATQGDNTVDNVEQVFIENPVAGQTYTITVNHKGTLVNGAQNFAFVVTGIDSTMGTAELDLNKVVSMYPNPVVDNLSFQMSKELKNAQVKVFNQMGQIVYADKFDSLKNKQTIDFKSFPSGTYMVYIKSDEGTITKKIIKK